MRKFFRQARLHFFWINNKTFADIHLETNDVRLNLVLMITESVTHEYFHWRYPKASEARVRRMTYNRITRMSKKEHLRLFFKIMARVGRA